MHFLFFLIGAFVQNIVTALPQPADDLFQDSSVYVSPIGVGGSGKRGDSEDVLDFHE